MKAAEKGFPGKEVVGTNFPFGYHVRVSCQLNHAEKPFFTIYSALRYQKKGSYSLRYAPHLSGNTLKIIAIDKIRIKIDISIRFMEFSLYLVKILPNACFFV